MSSSLPRVEPCGVRLLTVDAGYRCRTARHESGGIGAYACRSADNSIVVNSHRRLAPLPEPMAIGEPVGWRRLVNEGRIQESVRSDRIGDRRGTDHRKRNPSASRQSPPHATSPTPRSRNEAESVSPLCQSVMWMALDTTQLAAPTVLVH